MFRLAFILLVCLASTRGYFVESPEDLVNILGGTDSHYDLSTGSTLPLICRPWGFNAYAPQTDDDPNYKGWWFHPSDRRFFGLRVTHQPSPWISDYGNFLIKASIPASKSGANDQYSGYSAKRSTFSPYFFSTQLLAYATENEVTTLDFAPSNHGGIMKIRFPTFTEGDYIHEQTRRISIILNGNDDQSKVGYYGETPMISGYTTANSGGVGSSEAGFAHHFVALVYSGADGVIPAKYQDSTDGSHADSTIAWMQFASENVDNQFLTIRFATSFISHDQAMFNLETEVGVKDMSFDDLKRDAKMEWRNTLSRVQMSVHDATETKSFDNVQYNQHKDIASLTNKQLDQYITFYSSLYRASLFPRELSEPAISSTKGNTYKGSSGCSDVRDEAEYVHWSPYATAAADRVKIGRLTTDSGFWDAWNTVYPLLSLFHRPRLGAAVTGWLNSYNEGGWLPKWASPGYRGSMVGTMGDVSLADAIVNDVPGFDKERAYRAIRKDAFEIPPEGMDGVGRPCLQSYLDHGYIPHGAADTTGGTCDEVVSRTLNYMHSDYAIAQAAIALGHTDDAAVLLARSSNYSLLFDGDTGFFRSRAVATGKWTEPFDSLAWGGDYTEGGPWQFRYYVPWDAEGLAQLYESHGKDLCTELDRAQTMELSPFRIGAYSNEIHEQTEMADRCWGQYSHNNQPMHHVLYMYMHAGYGSSCAHRGQYYIQKTVNELYTAGSDMFSGDEDNGEMGAWYVLSSLGLYGLSPGSGEVVLGAPSVARAKVDVSDLLCGGTSQGTDEGKIYLIIETINGGGDNVYVQEVEWNGEKLPASTVGVPYSELVKGGSLTFHMGQTPAI